MSMYDERDNKLEAAIERIEREYGELTRDPVGMLLVDFAKREAERRIMKPDPHMEYFPSVWIGALKTLKANKLDGEVYWDWARKLLPKNEYESLLRRRGGTSRGSPSYELRVRMSRVKKPWVKKTGQRGPKKR